MPKDIDAVPELKLFKETEINLAGAIRKSKLWTGETDADGRSRIPPRQFQESSYPFGFTIRAFENFGNEGIPTGVGDAVFVVENWNLIGVVEFTTTGNFQWNVECYLQAKNKRNANGRIQENLLNNGNYRDKLAVAAIVEYYIAT